MLTSYLKYRLAAKGKQALHSPYMFRFFNEVVRYKGNLETKRINTSSALLKRDGRILDVTDFGAGSHKASSNQRSVAEISKHAATTKRWGRFLYALSRFVEPEVTIELGGNLGVGTAYLAASGLGQVFAFEGCPQLTENSGQFLNQLGYQNATTINGRFQDTLPASLNNIDQVDLAFIDGDHTLAATRWAFHTISPKLSGKGVMVFDDIRWSADMFQAWEEIKRHPKVRVSIDLFFKGVLCFDERLSKEEYVLRH